MLPREPDGARELVVQVDREVVARRGRVPDGLILGDRVRDLGEGRALGCEAMVGSAFADALGRLHASEELGHVLLVHELAVLRSCLRPDDDRRPVRAPEDRDRRRPGADSHPGLERPVEEQVLLVVDDVWAHVLRGHALGRTTRRLPGRAATANTGPPGTSSVAAA